ncbi:hypothetical protein L7F22_024839 [Adiantum nelumboides]|nr:hypothetical protein [Adiantum nelumboides]
MTSGAGVLCLQPKQLHCSPWANALGNEHGHKHGFACFPAFGHLHTPSQASLHYSVHDTENGPATCVNPVYHHGDDHIDINLPAQKIFVERHQSCHSSLSNKYPFHLPVQCAGTATMYKGGIVYTEEPYKAERLSNDAAKIDSLQAAYHVVGREECTQTGTESSDVSISAVNHAYVLALEACSLSATILESRLTHSEIIAQGYAGHSDVRNLLISMYSRCGSIEDAFLVLQRLPKVDLDTWNSLITSYTQNGHSEEVLCIYKYMQSCSILPDAITYVHALKACYGSAFLEQGREIHCQILERGVNLVGGPGRVGNSLVVMYSKCGCLEGARTVFESLPERDVVTWNSFIDGHSKSGFVERALNVYHAMCRQGIQPTLVTFVCTLKACSTVRDFEEGQRIHAQIVARGIKLDPFIENAILDLYCKCGSFEDARFLFDGLHKKSVITWNTLITGYSLHECGHLAIDLFRKMQNEGPHPDSTTFVCILKACSSILNLDQGRELHCHIVKIGMDIDTFVVNILIKMYGHCGSTEDAQSVFDLTQARDVVTWSALMTSYIRGGHGKDVLQMFEKMRSESLEPDEAVFVCVLKACAHIAALEQGMELHACTLEKGCEVNIPISSTLITMYGKCGNLNMACLVFNRLVNKSVVSYNAMLAVFGEHGESRLCGQLYQSMIHVGMKPNSITFMCLLAACRSLDLVEEGCQFFASMQREHGIFPEIEHYGCMVDILGKTGHGDAAEDLIETVPTASNIVCWTSLLSSCKGYPDIPLGKRSFDHAVQIDLTNTSVYVLMSKLYKGVGLLKAAMEVESMRKHRNKWKKPGKAYIEVDKKFYEFVVGDKTHPQFEKINLKVKQLGERTAEKAFIANLPVDGNDNLCGHCEKLAIAFGLLSTNAGTTIRVAKNIRMCADCHTYAKLTSSIENREIVVSDSYCVHNFREGLCSCKD